MWALDIITNTSFPKEVEIEIELAYFYPELTTFSLLSALSHIQSEIRSKEGEEGTAKGFWRENEWKVTHLNSLLFSALRFADAYQAKQHFKVLYWFSRSVYKSLLSSVFLQCWEGRERRELSGFFKSIF